MYRFLFIFIYFIAALFLTVRSENFPFLYYLGFGLLVVPFFLIPKVREELKKKVRANQ